MNKLLRVGVSLALSAFFLWLAFHNVQLTKVFDQLRSVRLSYVGLYVLMLVFIQICRVIRWGVLIRPFARVSAAALFRIANLGMMLVLVLPLRLGELARPYLLKRENKAPLSAGIGSVVVERSIDGLLVTLLFFVATMSLDTNIYHVPAALEAAAYVALAIFAGVTAVVIITLFTHGAALPVLRRLLKPLGPRVAERAVGMLGAFVSGLQSLPNRRAVAGVIAWTLLYWGANGLGFYWVMLAFGWHLPLSAGFTLVSVVVIGIMIPAGPGFLGTYQGAVLAGLAIYGIDANSAAAYGLVIYPLNVLIVVGFGLPYLFSGRARVGEIVGAGAQLSAQGSSDTDSAVVQTS